MTSVGSRVRSSAAWPVLVGVALLAGTVAAGVAAMSLVDALTATGLPNPGPVTTYGLPFVRAAGEIAAVIAVGSFMFAAFLVPPQPNGVLDVSGYRALQRSEEHTSELQSRENLVCRLLLEKNKKTRYVRRLPHGHCNA